MKILSLVSYFLCSVYANDVTAAEMDKSLLQLKLDMQAPSEQVVTFCSTLERKRTPSIAFEQSQ